LSSWNRKINENVTPRRFVTTAFHLFGSTRLEKNEPETTQKTPKRRHPSFTYFILCLNSEFTIFRNLRKIQYSIWKINFLAFLFKLWPWGPPRGTLLYDLWFLDCRNINPHLAILYFAWIQNLRFFRNLRKKQYSIWKVKFLVLPRKLWPWGLPAGPCCTTSGF
jgi:hypothetical protein